MLTMKKAQLIIEAAIEKAKKIAANAFDISTLELGRNSRPGDQFFGIHASNHGRVMIFELGCRKVLQ
jgi:hypothetical protein